MTRRNEIEVLRMRQRVHDFRNANPEMSIRGLCAHFDLSYASLKDWITRPRPTDDEIAQRSVLKSSQASGASVQVPIKAWIEPDIYARVHEEMERQGAARNRIINNALLLYLDCMDRVRSNSREPVNVLGYR
jgi:hypothetical protein